MAGEKHLVGPTGLVFGGPHLMGGQPGTGVGPGYIAELLLLPDAEIRGMLVVFMPSQIPPHTEVCFIHHQPEGPLALQSHRPFRRVHGNLVPDTPPSPLCRPSLSSQVLRDMAFLFSFSDR